MKMISKFSFFLFFLAVATTLNLKNKINLPTSKLPVTNEKIVGAIVPHHDIAFYQIAHLVQNLPRQTKEVILLAPNHENKGTNEVITTETSFGENWVGNNPQILDNEHGVVSVSKYLSNLRPEIKITPFVIKRSIEFQHLEKLKKFIFQRLNNQTVVIASVDFSHYLSPEKASQKDELTLSLIENFDSRQLLELDETYLDSPASIYLISEVMKMNNRKVKLVEHTNSSQILGEHSASTTSYSYFIYY
jgi:MEMO1 family protein